MVACPKSNSDFGFWSWTLPGFGTRELDKGLRGLIIYLIRLTLPVLNFELDAVFLITYGEKFLISTRDYFS